jgi:phage/plasmid-associated DNA primase
MNKLIDQFKVSDDHDYNFVTEDRYDIQVDQLPNFWFVYGLYSKLFHKDGPELGDIDDQPYLLEGDLNNIPDLISRINRLKNVKLSQAPIIQHNMEFSPMILNIKLAFPDDNFSELIVIDQYKTRVRKCFMNILVTVRDIIKNQVINDGNTTVMMYMEQPDEIFPAPIDETMVFFSQIYFPWIRLNGPDMTTLTKYITTFINKNVINTIQQELGCINRDIITWTITNNVPLIGSRTHNMDVFQFKKLFKFRDETTEEQEVDILSIIDQDNIKFNIDHWDQHDKTIYLPLLCSADYNIPVAKINITNTLPPPAGRTALAKIEQKSMNKLLDEATELVHVIPTGLYKDYWFWEDVGRALYHCSEGREEGLQLWIKVSSNSTYMNDCRSKWSQLEETTHPVTIITLHFFAQKYNSSGYEKIREKKIEDSLSVCLADTNERNIARLFKALYPYHFMVSSYDSDDWYMYAKNIYVKGNIGELLMFINETFTDRLYEFNKNIATRLAEANGQTRAHIQSMQNSILKLISKLGTPAFKISLSKEIKLLYICKHLKTAKDTHYYFTGCANGVIDVRNNIKTLRPGKPEDYITKQTVGLNLSFTWNSPEVVECLEYLETVFPNHGLNMFIRRMLASRFFARNPDKKFIMFSGGGNNGKTVFCLLLMAVFRLYTTNQPSTGLTEQPNRDPNAPDPALVSAIATRLAFYSEASKNKTLDSALIKLYTGNENVWKRDLFQKGTDLVEMMITFLPIMILNEKAPINDPQQAIWNRFLDVPFESKFTPDAPLDRATQIKTKTFPITVGLENTINKLAPAMLWIIYQSFDDYIKVGLNPPDIVTKASEEYRKENDFYLSFISENLESAYDAEGNPDLTVFCTTMEVYNSFCKWWKAKPKFKSNLPPEPSTFITNISTRLKINTDSEAGKPVWRGYRMSYRDMRVI